MELKFTFLLLGAALCGRTAFAQMSGNYIVPSTATNGFSTLAAAVTALNTNGISSNVTINIAGGYVETAPTGGYILGSATLNASLNATKTLTFAKGTAGAKPILKGYTGTSTSTDCIFRIAGADYVTFDSLELQQNNTDTTNITAMEIGYGLYNRNSAAPFDGCNHITIKNNNITLNRSITTFTRAIYSAHNTPTGTTDLTLTTAADLHSDNKFYSNNISNTVDGILLVGYTAPSPYTLYDQNNDIGGNTAATGNIFTNVLGNNFTGVAAIDAENQNNINISNNSIDQLANGGTAAIGGAGGVITTGLNATATVSNNNINMTETAINPAYYMDGIYSESGHLIARKNNITVSETGGYGVENVGIYFTIGTNLDADSNRININQARAGLTAGIYSDAKAGLVKITNDTITLTQTAGNTSIATFNGINSVGNATSELIQNNVFLNTNIDVPGILTTLNFINSQNGSNGKDISGNKTLGNTIHKSGYVYCINVLDTINVGVVNIYNNNFSNITNDSSLFVGISYGTGPHMLNTCNIYNNTISNVSCSFNEMYGIWADSYGYSNILNTYHNNINNFSSGGQYIYGIYNSGNGIINKIYNNKVYNLSISGYEHNICGIKISNDSSNVYNNIVGNLYANSVGYDNFYTTIKGIYAGGYNNKIYHNTVYINNNQGNNLSAAYVNVNFGTVFGKLAIIKNNIFVNTSAAGVACAMYWESSVPSPTAGNFTSENNLLYTGTGSNSYILGGNGLPGPYSIGYPTMSIYKTYMPSLDTASVTENPTFASTNGADSNFLHFAPGTATLAENRGQIIAGYPTDFDGDIHAGFTGYTGTGTRPDIGADEGNFTYAYPLAIGLTSFTGKSITNGNQLDWKTATEAKSDIFELERSADGREYTGIAIIAAKGIASTYNYLDEAPLIGKNFYRLKNSEATGSYTYSNIVVLSQQDKNARISISPNPATANVHIELPYNGDNTATLRILDITGKVIRTMQPTSAVMDINIADLATGKYILEYQDQVNTISTTIAKK